MIKPPFNYTGNKNRLIEEFANNFFPKIKSTKFLDVFGGGGTISINVEYDNVTYNDKNKWVVSLLKIFQKEEIEKILEDIKKIIDKYNLSSTYYYGNNKYKDLRVGNNGLKSINEEGFKKLRRDINNTNKKSYEYFIGLLVISFYSFNNDIRFNKKGDINIPIGKTDFNGNTYSKLITFVEKLKRKNIIIKNYDFRDINIDDFDFFYLDPPYLGTIATYNSDWSEEDEEDLYEFILKINNYGKHFVLSNMSWIKGIKNKKLMDFSNKNNFNVIDVLYSYKSSSYNRERIKKDQEIIITNVKKI